MRRIEIPASAAPFFQEYDFSRLDAREHADLVIERLLAYGNRSEVRWLLSAYGRSAVSDWIERMGAQRLPWRRYHLWCHLFHLPLRERSLRMWPH